MQITMKAFFKQMHHGAKTFVQDEGGVTSIEYALIAALIAVVTVGSITNVGLSLKALYVYVANELAKILQL